MKIVKLLFLCVGICVGIGEAKIAVMATELPDTFGKKPFDFAQKALFRTGSIMGQFKEIIVGESGHPSVNGKERGEKKQNSLLPVEKAPLFS